MKVLWQPIWGSFHQNDRDLSFSYYEGNVANNFGSFHQNDREPTFPYYEGNVTRNLRDSTKLTEL